MKMARLYVISILTLLILSSLACSRKQSGVESGVQNGNDNANLQGAAQPGGIAGAKNASGRIFRGAIADKKVQLTLVREGNQLSGTYFYQKIGSDISLKGQIKGEDFTLQEFDNSGKQTGEFKGKWTEPQNQPGASLEGTWSKPGGKDALNFYGTEQNIDYGLRVGTKEIKEEDKKNKYSISVEYPELTGATNPNVDKFNQEVKNLATKEVGDFKKGQQEQSAEDLPPDSEMGSDLSMDYDVVLATNELVSVIFDVSNFEAGAAHPSNYSHVINYDLKNGKVLKLSDLFKPGSDYLNTISRYAINDLKKQPEQEGVDDEWRQNGAGPKEENYESWNISKKGLAITFDQYQVASYAAGPQHVLVPYPALKDMVRPDGPLAPLTNKG
jgi:hypothetical protein